MHGGDIYRNNVRYDFSVNVNPAGMPEGVREALIEAVHHVGEYPDLRHEALCRKLGEYYNLPTEWFVLGNGASELILALSRAIRPKGAMYHLPSYSGYAVALKSGSPRCNSLWMPLTEAAEFRVLQDIPSMVSSFKPELLILTNPGNPTGQLLSRQRIREAAEACKKIGCTLLLDECFMELTGREAECSMMSSELSAFPNLVLLRSFTKTYAIPGVRLGYAVCSDDELRQKLRLQLPEWNLSVFAERAGIACLQSGDYLPESIRMIREERIFLRNGLTQLGAKVYPSDANYMLIRTELPNLAEKLLAQGILVRTFGDVEGLDDSFYRIAVLDHEKNQILLDRISQLL